MAETRNLIPLREALRRLCCRRTKFYELLNAGRIVAYKDGHATLVDADSIDAYQASLPRVVLRRKTTQ